MTLIGDPMDKILPWHIPNGLFFGYQYYLPLFVEYCSQCIEINFANFRWCPHDAIFYVPLCGHVMPVPACDWPSSNVIVNKKHVAIVYLVEIDDFSNIMRPMKHNLICSM